MKASTVGHTLKYGTMFLGGAALAAAALATTGLMGKTAAAFVNTTLPNTLTPAGMMGVGAAPFFLPMAAQGVAQVVKVAVKRAQASRKAKPAEPAETPETNKTSVKANTWDPRAKGKDETEPVRKETVRYL